MAQVLRVNYRKTGGTPGLLEDGAGIAKGLTGSAGAANGFMFLPSISANTNAASIIAISAYGLMESFYGAGVYASGYAIQPLNIVPISMSSVAAGSVYMAVQSMHASGSLVVFTPVLSGLTVASQAVFQMFAVVISGP